MRPWGLKHAAVVVASLLFSGVTTALDVKIDSYTCNEDLPVTADIYMACVDGTSRCAFGEQITVYGNLHYNSIYNTAVSGDTAYLVAELSLFSIDFSLVNHQAVPLCYFSQNGNGNQGQWDQYGEQGEEEQGGEEEEGEEQQGDEEQGDEEQGDGERRVQDEYYEQADNYDQANNYNAQCPYDGSYPYKVEYVLPSAGSDSASWLASGWTGSGLLQMYATRNDENLIGECTLHLSTFVTKEDDSSLLGAPSAAATAGIALAIIFGTLLMCFYCYCCIKSRKSRKDDLSPGDDVTSSFRRLDEDDKPSSINVDAQSQATSKKSAKEML